MRDTVRNVPTTVRRAIAVLGVVALLASAFATVPAVGISKGLTKKKADKRYVNVGEKASDANALDGLDSAAFARQAHAHSGADISSGTVAEPRIDASLARDSEIVPAVLGSGALEEVGHSYCDLVAEPGNYAPCNRFITTVHDPANNVGRYTSIAIGTDGNPVTSYYDLTAGALVVAKCDDPACTGGGETITTVDDAGANDVGLFNSLAIGSDGNPVISYLDDTDDALKVAHCTNPACTASGKTTVDDPPNQTGRHTSIAIGTDGNPVISYYDLTAGALVVARCNDLGCSGDDETITTVDDPANNVGLYTSIAIGTDGNPVISYYDLTAGALVVARCNDFACAGGGETITTVDDADNVGLFGSIAIGADGNPVASYFDDTANTLKVARCNDPACAGGGETITTVDDSAVSVGLDSSIAIGTDGNPVISYMVFPAGILKVTRCNDLACAGGGEDISTVDDPANEVGGGSSIAIGTQGNPVISYHDSTAGALKVARLGV